MTDKQIKLDGSWIPMEEAIKAGLVSDRPDWRITLQADHIKRLEEELKAKEQECERLKYELILKDVANIELSDKVKKYEKAIDEIEEIADNNYENPEMERIFKIIGGLDV